MVGAATEPTVFTVFAAALLTALATGLGAMPLAFTKRASGSWLGVGNSIAASLMLGASVMLFYEGCALRSAQDASLAHPSGWLR